MLKVETYGSITIEYDLPPGINFPIGVNHKRWDGDWYITQVPITYRWRKSEFTIKAGYDFDGASIPYVFRFLRGFNPLSAGVWAPLLHDWSCDHPEDIDRLIGDTLFLLLIQLTRPDVSKFRAWCFYFAVRYRTFFLRLRSPRHAATVDKTTDSMPVVQSVARDGHLKPEVERELTESQEAKDVGSN